ncbi:putative transcription regulator protein, MarR [Mycobacterium antarcticum]|uniref:MarR family winged helix-turn-helix transcriptional regulator n=1 Tax=unclassified Mycolicibacterium TaxID=2636767 RepID=UPI00239AB9EB|nr:MULTISPECIES: MarR family transcriptional regulator [unclassified Mycolicibacterium]BDX30371.1 putative transcription regulator protein, MarR [Mycolicibacterium sp. TUM20985]GLP73811.1 putative transcription regulator protein, MarR [Mycolicibacterium sp. TUM20983]GLP79495.1 putative transcription regulator protein, MarR [Mycolicibacterium sp. TUM20984]
MSDDRLADEVWRTMAAVVIDNRDAWKRDVVETTGLPFSRIRVLRRLAKRPMTAKEISEAAAMDAPATSVAVNDLEDRGLVVREVNPSNRRCKVISLTEEGRRVVASIDRVDDPAPSPFTELSPTELSSLAALLAKLTAH